MYLTEDLTALGHKRTLNLCLIRDKLRRSVLCLRIDLPVFLIEIELRNDRDELHVGLPVGLQCSYILPVAIELIGIDLLSAIKEIWNNMLTEILARHILICDQCCTKKLPVEDIDTHRSKI